MKKKKLINLGLSLLIVATTLVGCGTKCTPKESAEVFCEIIYSYDISNVEKLGMSIEEAEEVKKKAGEDQKEQMMKQAASDGMSMSSEKYDKFADALFKMCSKIDYTVEEESIAGDTAKIKVKSRYVNFTVLCERTAEEIIPEFETKQFETEEEGKQIFSDMFWDKLVENMEKAEPSSETQEASYRFKKKDGVWLPEDEEEFANVISSLVLK